MYGAWSEQRRRGPERAEVRVRSEMRAGRAETRAGRAEARGREIAYGSRGEAGREGRAQRREGEKRAGERASRRGVANGAIVLHKRAARAVDLFLIVVCRPGTSCAKLNRTNI